MVVRMWLGRTRRADGDAYANLLERTGVRDCRATPGNLGVLVLRRGTGEEEEFLFLSTWESMERIKAFAGEDTVRARYYPEDDHFLLEKPPEVTHWTVAHDARPAAAPGQ